MNSHKPREKLLPFSLPIISLETEVVIFRGFFYQRDAAADAVKYLLVGIIEDLFPLNLFCVVIMLD